ncbi:hypothetical protein EYV94_28015, partial [Puteibacter caeruleilacunae]
HNGNISGIRWRNNDTKRAGYAFRYDGLNRLTKADYGRTYSSGNLSNYSYYDVSPITYDKNGNIQSLTRKTSSGSNREALTYTYSGNQLSSLSGTFNSSSISNKTFSYDDNGNATADNLRGINIEYFEELNLPKKYSNTSKNTQYEYDAAGVKWQKTVSTSSSEKMDYYGSFIYQGGSLDRILTSDGFYDVPTSTYHYYLKDHLGNTRMSFHYSGSTPVVDQKTEYYPFGSMFTENNLTENKYLYNGKELNNEFFENYDYGSRMYDAALARWHCIDPLADDKKYVHLSPYVYVANNPIIFIDPDGERIVLAGTAAQQQTTLNHLQKLTNDQLSINSKGEMIITKLGGANSGKTLTTGTGLIRDLNQKGADSKTMTISIGAVGSGNSEMDVNPTDATNGKGSDVTVNFDPSANPSIPTKDPATGNVSGKTRPDEIGLAHELIHGERSMKGKATNYSTTDTHTYKDAAGNTVTQTVPKEELQTVGLKDPNVYTENKIRKEQGLDERGAY